ncbi:MAG: PepSY domain-containing protein [Gemmatimonadota bacterium]|nr:MAG: PepSY domain-containing protein [Gemmatimonadota bacterium]
MKTTTQLVIIATILVLAPATSTPQTGQPILIRERESGLLAQARIPPGPARLAAFAEVPGARMVGATIERRSGRLVYSFELLHEGHGGTERVQIDATNGRVTCIEYWVELDEKGGVVMKATPELVSVAQIGYVAARSKVLAQVPNGRIVGSRLRLQQSAQTYVFDIEVSEGAEVKQVLVNAYSGAVIPDQR